MRASIFLATLSTLIAVSLTGALASAPFVIDLVDDTDTGDVGTWTSIAVDDSGHIHVAYFESVDVANGILKYAKRVDGVWSHETADALAGRIMGEYASIVVGPDGVVHISYYHRTGSGWLMYAKKSGGLWSSEVVNNGGSDDVGSHTAIGLNGSGEPIIVYADLTNFELLLAEYSGGGWVLSAIFTQGVGLYNSLAVDDYGGVHVSSYDGSNGGLQYFSRALDQWTSQTVEPATLGWFYTSIALDPQGNPAIAYYDNGQNRPKYASRSQGAMWSTEVVEVNGSAGQWMGLAIASDGTAHISFEGSGDLHYAKRGAFSWEQVVVDAPGIVGFYSSIALDHDGNPIIAYRDDARDALKVADAGMDLTSPTGGETWPVGSTQSVAWRGRGLVDISLSSDGGSTWTPLASGVDGGDDVATGAHDILVPHTPSRFSMIRVERLDLPTMVVSDSFFTIETEISLLSLVVSHPPDLAGNVIEWQSNPGPADLAGYRLDKSGGAAWTTLTSQTKNTSYHDLDGKPGDRYRLFAVNGLGQEFLLGESEASPQLTPQLSAWPVPYRSGNLTVSFGVTSFGSSQTPVEVAVFDVAGRRVRTIASGSYNEGVNQVTWDGRDASGRAVASGTYFLRVTNANNRVTRKLVVVR